MARLHPRIVGVILYFASLILAGGCTTDMQVVGPTGPMGEKGDPGDPGADGGQGVQGLQGPSGESGTDGVNGADGADGTLRVFGDGSAGARTISVDEDWSGANPVGANDVSNTQFTDLTVDSGVTLTLPSGTIIRCTGTFTNNGAIVVKSGAQGGRRSGPDASSQGLDEAAAHPGISLRGAAPGEIGDNAGNTQNAGFGGQGVDKLTARFILRPGPNAGGGGGPTFNAAGSAGGGSLVVLAQGAIVNNGDIEANGDTTNGGGGAGGILILASRESVTHAGGALLQCNGGNGENSTTTTAASGGGGGGIVHLLAPSITSDGTVEVSGGSAGNTATNVSAASRAGGAGGGACGGSGGAGSTVNDNAGAQGGANSGSVGYSISSEFDPTAIL